MLLVSTLGGRNKADHWGTSTLLYFNSPCCVCCVVFLPALLSCYCVLLARISLLWKLRPCPQFLSKKWARHTWEAEGRQSTELIWEPASLHLRKHCHFWNPTLFRFPKVSYHLENLSRILKTNRTRLPAVHQSYTRETLALAMVFVSLTQPGPSGKREP